MCKAPILVPGMWCPTSQQEFDNILMDVFEKKKPSKDALGKLNTVCLYLGATTVADMTNKKRHTYSIMSPDRIAYYTNSDALAKAGQITRALLVFLEEISKTITCSKDTKITLSLMPD
eukprot:13582114-Ditylum_brightwellii.AAC.1